METFAQRGLAASSLNHCGYTGLHPSHRRLLVASFYVGRPYSVTIPTTWDAFTKNLWVPFPMLAWLLHRRCHARCCLRPRGVGWYSSITHLPFRLRPLGKDRHDPKISVSRGYGSDSGLTPFTSLDSRISLYSGKHTTGRLTIPYPGGLLLSHSLATLNQRQVRTLNAHYPGSLPTQL